MSRTHQISRWWPLAREYYVRNVADRVRDTSPGSVSFSTFQSILDEYDDPTVFVHVGLSDVNAAFGGRSYERLRTELMEQFESVLVPGFTPSFRASGVYHKAFSRPQVGMFPRLFHGDAAYRTDDALHSILVDGPYRFEACDHHDSFGDEGCYAQLDRDNVLIVNIGTNRLVSTQFHYISMRADPPYHVSTTHDGILYRDETAFEEIEQHNDTFDGMYTWNRWKIEKRLEERGVLTRHDTNGLKLSFFRAGDILDVLETELEAEPYYMVS